MSLSKSWGYAVRALVQLAGTWNDPEHRWQAGDLAEASGLPASFLSKILQELSAAGLVDSARGRGGGVRLAVPPRDIRLLDVARATQDNDAFNLADAGFEDAPAFLRGEIERRWQPYRRGTVEFLTENTVADLMAEPPGAPLR